MKGITVLQPEQAVSGQEKCADKGGGSK